MKVTAVVAMAAMGFSVHAAQSIPDGHTVPVYVIHEQTGLEIRFAESQAAQIFARIGVRIVWGTVGRSPLPVDAIVVDLGSATEECPGALACAKPFEGVHVKVFSGRLRQVAPRGAAPALLAHVLVHEITHILEGTKHHSVEGVMKACWDRSDLEQMSRRPLQFTDIDVQLIRMGMALRDAKLLAAVRVER